MHFAAARVGPEDDGASADRLEHVARASVHPLRIAVLECLAAEQQPLSPRELAARVTHPLANVAYHVRQLENPGLIELAHTAPRRGAIEHFYRLAPARTAEPRV